MIARDARALRRACVSLCVAILLGGAASASAQTAVLWHELPADAGEAKSVARLRSFDLDITAFASLAHKRGGVTLALPLAQGGFADFVLEESGTLDPALAARYPQIRSLRGRDAAGRRVRLDVSPAGVDAMIFGDEGVQVIRPREKFSPVHESFVRDEHTGLRGNFRCEFEPSPFVAALRDAGAKTSAASAQSKVVTGDVRRSYRLALAATGEYTAAVCSPAPAGVACGLAAMAASINRVNEVYENDLSVTLTLVANNDQLVYTNAASDPYTNNSGSAMLGENQANITAVIGSAGYDIGHVFSTGGGGRATVGTTCTNGTKARGVTGRANPAGDPFDIDYVAHEIGHQFHATHTFNGSGGNCAGDQRNPASAFEPGSGSTIMGYAGICSSQNLQANSDPYFHARSLEEMRAEIEDDACDLEILTDNSAPTFAALPTYTIPARTPFALRAQAEDSDLVTYTWEQYDLGDMQVSAAPEATSVSAPILRSFSPTPDPERVIPRLSTLLGAPAAKGEVLPATSRALNFRVSARDNHPGGGAVSTADMQLNVVDTGASFGLLSQNTASETWTCGTEVDVSWDVAGTDLPPIGCAAVDIALSQDGGVSFDRVLASHVPNDGSARVRVPFALGDQTRLQLRCSDNIFLDINDADFSVLDPGMPAAGDDVLASSPEDAQRNIPAAALTGNDSGGGAVAVVAVSNPLGGSVVLQAGVAVFTPDPDAVGQAGFDYEIADQCDRGIAAPGNARVRFELGSVNDAPTPVLQGDVVIAAKSGASGSLASFAQVEDFGAADEAGQQVVDYTVTLDSDPAGILETIAIAPDGELNYTLTGNVGSAQIAVRVRDNGGTANGGQDTSAQQIFTLTTTDMVALAVAIEAPSTTVFTGETLEYALVLQNQGDASLLGVQLRSLLPAGLAEGTWSCTGMGAECPTIDGAGDIDLSIGLPPGASITITVHALVTGNNGATVHSTVEALLAVDNGIVHDSASIETQVVSRGLFSDSMESAD